MTDKRLTKQKSEIIEAVQSFGADHFTCDQLEGVLRGGGVRVAKSTIYRFINEQCSEGSINKFTFPGSTQACFQYIGRDSGCNQHFHMMCNSCGGIVHFEDSGIAEASKSLCSKTGHRIRIENTVFSGICSDCDRKEPK